MSRLELLAPAKNFEFGCEAINHGADAVYIGAPAFGARVAASNSLQDIERLVRYAHLYGAKVFTTVNTLLYDSEFEDVVRMINQLYQVGVDALIIQDMGLLQCSLPPIELHASTQCHNASIEQLTFLEHVGFKRAILARELSIEQIHAMRESCSLELEAFIHGALCVSYSGQCFLSKYLVDRSGNRGCCSQPCRSSYDLLSSSGKEILKDSHLFSLRDFNASAHLSEMIQAGITSFKIEGRLKDLSYVKNVTAYYRRLLDMHMEGNIRASSGYSKLYFEPDVERTFNRGYTDYFLRSRRAMASLATQKSLGKYIGVVNQVNGHSIQISTNEQFVAGDGLCYFDSTGKLQGFLVNRVEGNIVYPNIMPDIVVGSKVWRNHDAAFERLLSGKSAERKIIIEVRFEGDGGMFTLYLNDEDGIQVSASMDFNAEISHNPELNTKQIIKQLSKLGDSPFVATHVSDGTDGKFFIPTSMLNSLRRQATENLIALRINYFHPSDCPLVSTNDVIPPRELDFRANVVNTKAEQFYKHHGIRLLEYGMDATSHFAEKPLMTTKYCLRYELGKCLKGKENLGEVPIVDIAPSDQLILLNNRNRLRLEFDCSQCRMLVFNC